MEGNVVHISRPVFVYCPFKWINRFREKTGLADNSENYIICRLERIKLGHKAHGHIPLSDSTIREIFNKDIAPICENLEPSSYSVLIV